MNAAHSLLAPAPVLQSSGAATCPLGVEKAAPSLCCCCHPPNAGRPRPHTHTSYAPSPLQAVLACAEREQQTPHRPPHPPSGKRELSAERERERERRPPRPEAREWPKDSSTVLRRPRGCSQSTGKSRKNVGGQGLFSLYRGKTLLCVRMRVCVLVCVRASVRVRVQVRQRLPDSAAPSMLSEGPIPLPPLEGGPL